MMDYFVPPQLSTEPPALVSQVSAAKPKALKAFTICWDIESGNPDSGLNQFSIFKYGEANTPSGVPSPNSTVRLLQAPAHGKVTLTDNERTVVGADAIPIKWRELIYQPVQDYVGKDSAVFLVTSNNRQYQVKVNFWVVPALTGYDRGDLFCKYQKFGADTNLPKTAIAWMNSAELSGLLAAASGVTYSFTDLPGTALGQTTGEGAGAAITLDTNAAGHGWYVDPTPLDPWASSGLANDDYLPTSNPNIWKAKAGTDAAGKMDMLSVLLHEYGHALKQILGSRY